MPAQARAQVTNIESAYPPAAGNPQAPEISPFFSTGCVTPQNNMRRTLARDVLRKGVSELDEINVAKESFARAEEYWGYPQIRLIDESGAKILLNGDDATSDTNVFPIRGCRGSLEGAVDYIRHEMERRSSLDRNRFARVVGQNEHGDAKRRRVSPPALPGKRVGELGQAPADELQRAGRRSLAHSSLEWSMSINTRFNTEGLDRIERHLSLKITPPWY